MFKDKKWPDLALLILRIALGVIFIIAGYNKLFGATGVDGFAGSLMKLNVPLPAIFSWLVSIVEFFGGVAILAGVFTRIAAVLAAINMLVAFLLVQKSLPAGDLVFALFAIAVALALAGSGKYAVRKS